MIQFSKEHGIHETNNRIDRGKDEAARRCRRSRKRRAASACFDRFEQQKKMHSLELGNVSLSVTIETKEKMTDSIKLDLNRSEAHVSKLLQQIRDHQDTINSLSEAVEFKDLDPASSVVSGRTTSCLIDRTLVAMETYFRLDPNTPSCRDHKAGSNIIATRVQSNTVPSF